MSAARWRIDQQELKCINGCGYYGNAKFDYLCSICFRERNERRKRDISLTPGDATAPSRSPSSSSGHSPAHHTTTPSAAPKPPDTATGATKKKFMVPMPAVIQKTLMHKSKNKQRPEKHIEKKVAPPDPVDAQLTAQLHQLRLPEDAKRLLQSELELLDSVIHHYLHSSAAKNIEELSESVQRSYNSFSTLVQTDPRFLSASPEDRESAIDFFEKVIMTKNHKYLFSPYFTADEESDDKIQRRIKQLSWVTAKHLACSIDEVNTEARDLVYNAITELVAIDSFYSPQEKLECTVRCARHIFELLRLSMGGPANTDEFLPALIFVVLKANPVRLHSNINFVTRFTNESRLIRGEGAFCFTNLCCAINFIENLKADSLSLRETEFDALMNGEKPENTAWETALLACESVHQIKENMKRMAKMRARTEHIDAGIANLRKEMEEFMRDVNEKVEAAIARAPLTVLPIKTPKHLIPLAREGIEYDPSADLAALLERSRATAPDAQPAATLRPMSPVRVAAEAQSAATYGAAAASSNARPEHTLTSPNVGAATCMGRLSPLPSFNQSNLDLSSVSPLLNYTPFQDTSLGNGTTDSMEDLLFGFDQLNRGLSSVNYEIDYSDNSAASSVGDDIKASVEEFDPLRASSHNEHGSVAGAPPAAAVPIPSPKAAVRTALLPPLQLAQEKPKSLLESDSPPNGVSLPSPLQPTVADYRGFSACKIPSISCNTGDFSLTTEEQQEQAPPLPPRAVVGNRLVAAAESPRRLIGDRC